MEQTNVKVTEVKIPKKRGRKPTGKIFQLEKGTVKNIETDNECIIAYLPLSIADTKNIADLPEVIIEKSAENKTNGTIMNDLKNILNTSEGSLRNEFNNTQTEIEPEKKHSELRLKKHNEDDMVVKLKHKIEELERLLYDNVKFDRLNDISIDLTKADQTDIHCWWCCHKFDHQSIGIPDLYRDDIFYTYGYFCSFNCAKSYNLDYIENKTDERNCLLMMFKKRLINEDSFIKPANPRQSLKMFGGHQTIDEFRKDFRMVDKTSLLIFPPLKPLKIYIEDEYKHKISKFQNDYKVKRNKPLLRTSNSLINMLKIKE
jgi:hypothetical protein